MLFRLRGPRGFNVSIDTGKLPLFAMDDQRLIGEKQVELRFIMVMIHYNWNTVLYNAV